MKTNTIIPSFLAIAAIVAAAGCQTSQPQPNRLTMYEDANGGAAKLPGGGGVDFVTPPAWEGHTHEGYPAFLGENKTLEARVTGLRLSRIPADHPAFIRFARKSDGETANVQVVSLDVVVSKGAGRDGVVQVACYAPTTDYMQYGQRVVFRTYGRPDAGYARVVLASPARYCERYPMSFAVNSEYTAIIEGVYRGNLSPRDSAYPRIMETGGRLPLGDIRCQLISLRVQADDREVWTQIYMPQFPVWRKGDVVTYRTFGNPTNGFADIEIRELAGTGEVPRTAPNPAFVTRPDAF